MLIPCAMFQFEKIHKVLLRLHVKKGTTTTFPICNYFMQRNSWKGANWRQPCWIVNRRFYQFQNSYLHSLFTRSTPNRIQDTQRNKDRWHRM